MSDFSKEKFLGGKLTPTSIFRRIGEVWESSTKKKKLKKEMFQKFMSKLI